MHNSPGPIKVVNNYLEAAGENFMAGGADPAITNLVPSDIEIRRNRFYKPLSWIGSAWSVKNLLELKNAQRVLIEGNSFENNWLAAQNGFSVLITPRNQSNGAPWSVTQDITIRLNKLVNLGQGFNISGTDTTYPSQRTRRILIENNTIEVTGLNGADGKIFGITNGPVDTTIRHNTGFTTRTMAFSENSPQADQFDFRNNIFSSGDYGFIGTGTGTGTATLNAFYLNYTFTKNVVIGGSASSYPADNFFPASTSNVGFVNYSSGNYALASGTPYKGAASDGKDIGADITALNAALAGTGGGSSTIASPTNLRVVP